ncbi:hypothetical protein QFC22_000617 [Naganishia vaughanmartiniae]|uniref:Uncharacterized protein n=1 Tax=Naganishia vaughanmartiniae TaxID=1424756 RepID=A0ACC2XQK5_9TREE|nr:hypothetical protein QFC22_000617 [Naganishia vaughanmartiniae]
MSDTNLSPPSTTTFHSLSRLRRSSNPLPRVAHSFDTHSARLFRQSMPPVPAFEPQPAENVAQRMARMVHELALVVELRETGWREREDAMWVFSTLGMGVEGEEMAAVMTPAQDDYSPTTQGFDDQPSILAQWMQSHALVDEFDLECVLYSVASADGGAGGFETIEANIRLDMRDRSQNRARQYRQLPLSARRWLAIGNDIPPPLARFFPALQPALGALYGDTLLDALLGTFDLDLITPGAEGKEEYGWMYWFISRVAGDRLRMGQAVDERSVGGEASWRTVWARAWAEIGNALFLAFTLSDIKQETSANDVPFSSSLRSKSRRRAVFEYRFRPFVSTMVDDADEPLSPSYEEYVAACRQVKEIPIIDRDKVAESAKGD